MSPKKIKKNKSRKHVAMRTCVACRSRAPKCEMVRFAVINDKLAVDCKGKLGGRGANICANVDCFEKVSSESSLDRALNIKVGKNELENLRGEFKRCIESKGFREGKKKVTYRVNLEKAVKKVGKEVVRGSSST